MPAMGRFQSLLVVAGLALRASQKLRAGGIGDLGGAVTGADIEEHDIAHHAFRCGSHERAQCIQQNVFAILVRMMTLSMTGWLACTVPHLARFSGDLRCRLHAAPFICSFFVLISALQTYRRCAAR
jgi:hypothetical protein